MVGFVRFARSPRHIELDQARALARQTGRRALRVVLLVDPDDRAVDEAVEAIEPAYIQLHGTETPERVGNILERTQVSVIKAIGIGGASDLARLSNYREAAARILLDARSPPGGLPGGNGRTFDWSLLAGLRDRSDAGGLPPVILSGGLTPDNVSDAINLTGVRAVDVSSGVESAPGRKDPDKIAAFVAAARAAFAATAGDVPTADPSNPPR